VLTSITQIYLPPPRLSINGMSITCPYPLSPALEPHSITAVWLVLMFRLSEDRRLSWPGKAPTEDRAKHFNNIFLLRSSTMIFEYDPARYNIIQYNKNTV